MDDLANYCLQLYGSKGMSDLRASRGNYDTMLVLEEFHPKLGLL